MGRKLADFARDDLRARRVAILYEVGRSYSAKLARSFADAFVDPGRGRVAAEFFYLPLETDFRNQLREVAAFRADVLFLPGSFTDATLIAGQAERLGIRPTLLGGDAWSNRLLFKRGGPVADRLPLRPLRAAGRVPRALPARVRRRVRRVPGHPGLRRGAGRRGRPSRAARAFGRRPHLRI